MSLVLNTKKFVPSEQQSSFFSWIETGKGSGVLVAVAGAGKTTTLVRALNLMNGTIFFGAYNKKIADEIRARAPQKHGLEISTMHAAGLRAWKKVSKYPNVDGDKVRNIFRAAVERNMQYSIFQGVVMQLVSLAKQAGVGIDGFPKMESRNTWMSLISHYDVETFDEATQVDNTELIIKLSIKTLQASISQNMKVIDFDDMIYAPLYHGVKFDKFDWVLVDEAQDTNATRRELALRMLKECGRLVAVGDPKQSVYGFTGADSTALELIKAATNAAEMQLTTSFRCPKEVVKYSQQWASHIQAAETAPDGIVRNAAVESLYAEAKVGDAVLCRFNAPLVEHVYKFIAVGTPAMIEGREIGKGLVQLARRWKVKSLSVLRDRLLAYVERGVKKYTEKEQPAKAQAVEDKAACLAVIIDRVFTKDPNTTKPVEAVVSEIEAIFSDVQDTSKVVLLSSIHKSKGREWKKVIWLQTGPNKRAKLAWQMEAEANLNYVACTRSMHELVLIDISSEK